jgi:drug/metabolite transporter (DMT)-like permease
MGLKDTLLCSVFAVALPVGQAMFKWAAIYNTRLEGPFALRVLQNWPLFGAFAWYGMTALLWFYVLTRVPLSSAYLFSLMGSALVPLIAWAVFKEPFSWPMLAGYALMLAGLTVVMTQANA